MSKREGERENIGVEGGSGHLGGRPFRRLVPPRNGKRVDEHISAPARRTLPPVPVDGREEREA